MHDHIDNLDLELLTLGLTQDQQNNFQRASHKFEEEYEKKRFLAMTKVYVQMVVVFMNKQVEQLNRYKVLILVRKTQVFWKNWELIKVC